MDLILASSSPSKIQMPNSVTSVEFVYPLLIDACEILHYYDRLAILKLLL